MSLQPAIFSRFWDLAMCECIKNGLSTCYWFEAFISVHSLRSCSGIDKQCGNLLYVLEFDENGACVGASLAFGAQAGGVIIVGHGETFLLRDARRKCMWCFEFVFMRQSAISVQTRRRYFLLFPVI